MDYKHLPPEQQDTLRVDNPQSWKMFDPAAPADAVETAKGRIDLEVHVFSRKGKEMVYPFLNMNPSVSLAIVRANKSAPSGYEVLWLKGEFKYGAGRMIGTIPSGQIDAGEVPAQAAAREASEESGYAVPVDDVVMFGNVFTLPANSNKVVNAGMVMISEELQHDESLLDGEIDDGHEWCDLSAKADELLMTNGQHQDATMAVLMAARYLKV